MDDKLVEYRVDEHDKKLAKHDKVLDDHEQKINSLAVSSTKLADSIDNLSNNMEKGFGLLKWLLGVLASGVIGFFFYMIQSLF